MGFQSQRNTSWVPAQIWAERVLADGITIDGRKEWICKFCSETNVGPGGAADDVALTSQQICRRSTKRQSLRKKKGGLQDHLLRVVEK